MWLTVILCLFSPVMIQSDTYEPFIISEIVPAEPQKDGANVQEAEAVLEKILSEIGISGFNTHMNKPVPMNKPSDPVIVIVDYDNKKPQGPSYNRYPNNNKYYPVPNRYPGNYPPPPHDGYHPHHNNNSPYNHFKYPPPPHNRYPYPNNYHNYPPPNRYPSYQNDNYPPHLNKYPHDRYPSPDYNNNQQNTGETYPHNQNDFNNNFNLNPNHENNQNNPNSGFDYNRPHNEGNYETSTPPFNENPGVFKPDQGSENKQTIPTVAPQTDPENTTPAQDDDESFPIDVRFKQ